MNETIPEVHTPFQAAAWWQYAVGETPDLPRLTIGTYMITRTHLGLDGSLAESRALAWDRLEAFRIYQCADMVSDTLHATLQIWTHDGWSAVAS